MVLKTQRPSAPIEEDGLISTRVFDPKTSDAWILDHCPSYVIPTLPFTVMAGLMQESALALLPKFKVVGIEEVQVTQWLSFLEGPQEVQAKAQIKEQTEHGAVVHCSLYRYRKAPKKEFSRFEPFCHGTVLLGDAYLSSDLRPQFRIEDHPHRTSARQFYGGEKLFSGKCLQLIEEVVSPGPGQAVSLLRTRPPDRVPSHWGPAFLMDAATQTIAEMGFNPSKTQALNNPVGAARKILKADFFSEYPTQDRVLCEVSFAGEQGNERFPEFDICIFDGSTLDSNLWARFRFMVILFPMGRLFEVTAGRRVKFLKGRHFLKGVTMAHLNGFRESTLSLDEVKQSDWLPQSVAHSYLTTEEEWKKYHGQLPEEARKWLTIQVAAKDLVAQTLKTHPSQIQVKVSGDNRLIAGTIKGNVKSYGLNFSQSGKQVQVCFDGKS